LCHVTFSINFPSGHTKNNSCCKFQQSYKAEDKGLVISKNTEKIMTLKLYKNFNQKLNKTDAGTSA
jgi:hypothetical protein